MARPPDFPDSDDRVVKFSPRPAKPAPAPRSPAPEPVDYRQRMWANLAATALAVVLIVVGVWLVTSLNHMRQTQDCIMMGLRNCGEIDTTPHS
ncbi:MAG: hypothetical protein J0G33_17320 [Afipia felis]|jgi:ferric-dicitrate binding protein FerR (iron transport regulator)|uniref:Uncharacterized protein n=2 Tax=Afipia felis TaxID=1035 RepID=A0A380W8W2_AFIFE|nr:hypothetical protein [Afipia felis]EKS28587.1 hypothetical protein HMPREF9697_01115 [Afipia felis ATCC 53690]MBN9604684.1 hypothetical protein [Afipia felis]SUU77295.1 Uncharacterised protein [Afipia felis]SUU85362.1 Uncharacterised protein [Afipia felis]